MNFKEIKEAVRCAREVARYDACDGGRIKGFLYSRGQHITGVDAKGDICWGEAESDPWDGTLKSLENSYGWAKGAGAVKVFIEGGFNLAESPRAYGYGEYEPWVGGWEVEVAL